MREYICPVCRKKFIQNAPCQYLYREGKGTGKLFCSYTCWREATKDNVPKFVRGRRK